MTPIQFKRYSVNQTEPTVIAERITHWYQIDYNGNYGTEIVLDTGATIRVGNWPHEVEAAISKAMTPTSAIPEIDYDALIKAAGQSNKSWTQGKTGCVAFSRGAQWFRLQALAAKASA